MIPAPSPATEAAVVVGLLLVSAVAVVGVVTAAEPSITNVTVSPQEPRPGELVRFTTTVQNAEGSGGSFDVTSVRLRQAGTTREYARAEDLGTIPPGSSLSVPLTTQFDSDGVYDLRIAVTGRDENNEIVTLRYPVTVVVSERSTQLSVDVDDPVVGATTAVNVTVSNGGADPLRQLDLRVGGDGVSAESPRRLLARLESGQDRTFSYDVTFAEAGETSIEATLEYAATSGQTQTVRRNETVVVDELREDVAVDAAVAGSGGGNRPLAVEVTNFGNARLEDVSVRVTDGDRTAGRRSVEPVDAGTSREVRVNLSDVEDAELDVTVAYETGGRTGEAATSVRYTARPGRIELTGVDFSREGDTTVVSGAASNVGLSEVNSVVLRVLPTDGVEPVAPNREYFVGTVPASDFVSFDLTANVRGNVTSIPVQVTYLSEGVERSERVSVPYEPVDTGEEGADGGGGLGTVGAILLLVAVVAVAGVGVLWWRRRSDGGE